MFDTLSPGQTVRIHFAGSMQGLAMRVRYEGERDGVHRLSGMGVMADVAITASDETGQWLLGSGRALTAVEAV